MKTTKLLLIAIVFSAIQLFAIDGFPGTALEFDGVDDYVSGTGIDTALTSISLEAWVYHNDLSAGQIQKYIAIGPEVAVLRYDGAVGIDQLHFYIKQSSGAFYSLRVDNILTANKWFHVAGTYDGVTMNLYLNGELIKTETPNGGLYQPDGNFSLSKSSEALNGKLEELRIWNTIRTDQEIRESMYLSLSGSETGLVSYWQLNDGSGTVLSDVVGGNTGTLYNMDDTDWVDSTIPLGGGFSDTQVVSTTGVVNFTDTDLSMDITAKLGTNTLVVSKLDIAPNLNPTGVDGVFDNQYWVANSFGSGMTTAEITFAVNENIDIRYESATSYIKLYGRDSNADNGWIYISDATNVNGTNNTATFTGISNFSQFIITQNNLPPIAQIPGSALEFDGIDDFVNVGNDTSLDLNNTLTIEAWVKPDILTSRHAIFSTRKNDDDGAFQLEIGTGQGTNRVAVTGSGTWVAQTNNNVITAGEWTHIAYTRTGTGSGTHAIYINGEAQSLVSDAAYEFVNNTADKTIAAGRLGNEKYDGKIDEVRVWNIARTEHDIREGMNLPLIGNESGLVSYWQLNDGTDDLVADVVGNNNGYLQFMDNSDWVNSTIPFGGGTVNTKTVSSTGLVDFTGTDLSMDFTEKIGTNTIVVTKINLAPNISPSDADEVFDNQYWVVRKYGAGSYISNSGFTISEDLTIEDENYPGRISLYTRDGSSDTDWLFEVKADSVNSLDDRSEFSGINDGGQFLLGRYTGINYTDLYPQDDQTNVLRNENLILTFDGDIIAGLGNMYIRRSTDDSIYETISASSTAILDSTVTIDPVLNLEFQTDYYVLIDSTAFMTTDSILFEGIDDKTAWNFSTVEFSILNLTPSNSANDIVLDSNLEIVFNTNVIAGSGNVIIRNYSDDSIYETIPVSSTAILDSTVTIDPVLDFELQTEYYVCIDSTAFMTSDSVYFKGVYTNDDWSFETLGIFSDIEAGLTEASLSSAVWGDYDNDGDLDLLLTGYYFDGGSHYFSVIYQNNLGIFTDINAGLTGVYAGSAAWGDYDNDGDLDILLTGCYNDELDCVSKIYRNDSGVFTDINAGLEGVWWSSVAWGDYDNDGDLDILLSGGTGPDEISIIYNNDSGVFTDINAGLIGVMESSVAWGDYDNDGDLDILLTGDNGSYYISTIYRNNSGVFTDINAGLEDTGHGSVAWGDYDNDGDLDILLTGMMDVGFVSIIYNNDSGVFTDINAGLTGVYGSSVAWGDYDNDGDLDILLTGYPGSSYISKIYNNNSGVFTDSNAGLYGVYDGSVAWGDYDNDGDLDILLTGTDYSYIYRNGLNVVNNKPNPPSNLSSVVTDSTITFSWDKATDNETPQDGLSYNLYIGTVDNKDSISSSMSDIGTGYRKVVALGNANQNNSWTIKDLEVGTYYWSVQAVDHAFAGSEFSTEQIFIVMGSPQNVITDISGNDIHLSWDEVFGATSYKVYASTDPYGTFTDFTDFGALNALSWELLWSGDKLFFYVVATTGGKISTKKINTKLNTIKSK